MNKIRKLTHNSKFKKVSAAMFALMICCMSLVPMAFATDGTAGTDMTAEDAATSIFQTVFNQINVGSIVGIIAIALGAGVGLFFAWWAIRKVIRVVKGGLNGKLKI